MEGLGDDEEHTRNDDTTRLINRAIAILHDRRDGSVRGRTRIVELAQQFVEGVGDDIQEMITDTRTIKKGYQGLDSERDTEAEVTTMLGFYPEVLTQTEERWNIMVPIQCLASMFDHDCKFVCNTKAVSFVPLFAELAIQFNSFEAHERGGLLRKDEDGDNVLTSLVTSSRRIYQELEDPQFIDSIYLAVVSRLRQSKILKREDSIPNQLVPLVCGEGGGFQEARFRFLTEWCPESLLRRDEHG